MNFSDKFKEVLIEINDDISSFLLTLEGTEQEIENVDLSSREGYITYTRSENKTRIKSGRFVSMLSGDGQYSAREIELFVNKFKSISEYNRIKANFVLGEGEDFEFAYNTENYQDRTGSLNGSCMNNVGLDRLKLYVDNPTKIKILMLKDNDGKLLGRSVIWKNAFIREGESAEDRNNSETFKNTIVDRIYTTQDYYINIFEKYASEKGWYVRQGGLDFKRPDGEVSKCRVKCNLKEFEFGNYPYLDTMRSVSKNGTISNKRWKGEVRFY